MVLTYTKGKSPSLKSVFLLSGSPESLSLTGARSAKRQGWGAPGWVVQSGAESLLGPPPSSPGPCAVVLPQPGSGSGGEAGIARLARCFSLLLAALGLRPWLPGRRCCYRWARPLPPAAADPGCAPWPPRRRPHRTSWREVAAPHRPLHRPAPGGSRARPVRAPGGAGAERCGKDSGVETAKLQPFRDGDGRPRSSLLGPQVGVWGCQVCNIS